MLQQLEWLKNMYVCMYVMCVWVMDFEAALSPVINLSGLHDILGQARSMSSLQCSPAPLSSTD